MTGRPVEIRILRWAGLAVLAALLVMSPYLLTVATPYSICRTKPGLVGEDRKIAAAIEGARQLHPALAAWADRRGIDCCSVAKRLRILPKGSNPLGERIGVGFGDHLWRGWSHVVTIPAPQGGLGWAAIVDNCGKLADTAHDD